MKSKYIIIFAITFLLGVAAVFAYLLSVRAPRPITLNPVSLEVTEENQGRRCEDGHWDDASENRLCYRLQEKLYKAASENDLNGIREALKLGANVNGSYYQSDEPLFVAVMFGKKEAVLLLLENGANINETNKWGINPLQIAVIYRQKEVVEVLLENKADVCHKAHWDVRELPNPTALDIERKFANGEMVDLLTDFGAQRCIED